ncbi:hypothetical protein ABL78_7089 [Leptomonas seymouri]|uniref:Uncharacterized protein n=1 Tax=Leptomonas seymouri TaxID=5684 RepID=A0A0N1IIA3_LEPSE|nr:hypothetical protein ABL78_7089 [Leptomonas seymouri]|eukprot:KPI83871.1 hypothetical protein ABL78_7089 [Leptomonas seymouri]
MPPKASPTISKESTDPMLQEMYVQDDAKDFRPSTDEIAAFEERLQHGRAAAPPNRENLRRHSAPVAEHPPANNHASHPAGHQHAMSSSFGSGTPPTAQNSTRHRRFSEAEQEEAIQHQEDVDGVRQLDNRFAVGGDDSE